MKTNNKTIVLKKKVLKNVLAKINEGGVTYCPLLNIDYAKTKNIAIAPFPERSQVFKGKPTEKMLKSYCLKNNDLLNSGFSFGAWPDNGCKKTYFDISAPIPLSKKTKAVNLGKCANQIAGFNLFDFSEIPLGGTGEFKPALITPFGDRLSMALKLLTNQTK
jgi:hypothetical protein